MKYSLIALALLASSSAYADCGNGNGCNGIPGPAGPQGIQGIPGINGTNGRDGINGTNGTDGKDGLNGTDGVNGINGSDGKNGNDGTNGVDGQIGATGAVGAQGVQGRAGKDFDPAFIDKTNRNFRDLTNMVNKNKKRADAGTSTAMAAAGIPQVLSNQDFAVGAALGGYNSQTAIAVGFSARINNNVTTKFTVGIDSQHGFGYNAGIAIGW